MGEERTRRRAVALPEALEGVIVTSRKRVLSRENSTASNSSKVKAKAHGNSEK